MSPDYLLAQVDILKALGFSEKQFWNAFEFDKKRLSNKHLRIPIDAIVPVFKEAENALNDPFIGLRLGFQFRIGQFSQTGAIYSYCENLPQVIKMNQRYQKLAIDVAQIDYNIHATPPNSEQHLMQFMTYYEDHEYYRHITDLVMGAYGTTYRWLGWGIGGDIKAVHLPYPAPSNTDMHKQLFQADLHFDAPVAAIEFPAKMMVQQLTTHDPEKLARAIAQLDRVIGSSSAVKSLKDAVGQAMRRALDTGTISSTIIADRLEMTPQEFRSEMLKTKLSYRNILEEVRKDLFLEQYRAGKSFAQISQNLAYNDQAAFTRAFKRWYGLSPGQWVDKEI